MGYQPKSSGGLFGPRRRDPDIMCPDSCYGMLGCGCVPVDRHICGICQAGGLTRDQLLEHHHRHNCTTVVVHPEPAKLTVQETLRVSDAHGRLPEDPLYRLPHSKCSCVSCKDWRASNWSRLS